MITSLRRGYAETRHGQVHYQTAGEGDALLLLHATPRSSRAFEQLIPYLLPHRRVVAPDTLGFGQSDPLPLNASITTLGESVVDVLDALELPSAAVFGLHTGNKIAAAIACESPRRVTKLILCGMSHSIIPDETKREAAIRAILAAHPIDPDDVANPREKLDRLQGAASVAAMYQANYAFDLAATVAQLQLQTLVLELATPAEAHLSGQAEALAKLIPHGVAATLKRSDRDVLERAPEELAAVIMGFLAP